MGHSYKAGGQDWPNASASPLSKLYVFVLIYLCTCARSIKMFA